MVFLKFMLIALTCFSNFANAACPNGISGRGVNKGEAQQIVNLHNDIRLKIARGQLKGQPRGVSLKRLSWDQNLANLAQDVANSCEFEHQKVSDRRFPSVGQNLFMSWSSAGGDRADWKSAVNYWINEYKLYKYPAGFSLATGHYTQVVWDTTYRVGCGYAYYKKDGRFNKLYVCHYGPGGNYPRAPYKTGNSGCENLC